MRQHPLKNYQFKPAFLMASLATAALQLSSPLMGSAFASHETNTKFIEPPIASYADLKNAIIQNRLKSVDALMSYVRTNSQDSLDRFTLAFASRSLHAASFRYPRLIAFGKDHGSELNADHTLLNPKLDSDYNNLVFAVSGDPESKRSRIIEVMEFIPAENRFEFHEITFPENGLEGVSFTENAQSCLTCHGMNPKPIWDAYTLWPGLYGGEQHTFDGQTKEFKLFQDFKAQSSLISPYKHLDQQAVSSVFSLDNLKSPFPEVSVQLESKNHRRVIQEFIDNPSKRNGRFALAMALGACDENQLISILGYDINEGKSLLKLESDYVGERLSAYDIDLAKRSRQMHGLPLPTEKEYGPYPVEKEVAMMQFVLRHFNSHLRDWTLSLLMDSAELSTGGRYFFFPVLEEFRKVVRYDPDFGLFLASTEGRKPYDRLRPEVCQDLENKHQRINGNAAKVQYVPSSWVSHAETTDANSIIIRCATCHASEKFSREVPQYPLLDSSKMKELLTVKEKALAAKFLDRISSNDPNTRMPPAPHRALTSGEKEAFRAYLDALLMH